MCTLMPAIRMIVEGRVVGESCVMGLGTDIVEAVEGM